MIEEDITRALQSGAIGFIAASSIPAIPIAALGRAFNPPDDQKYIEFVQIRNNRNGEYWGKQRIYQGTFRVILHWPNDDKGEYIPLSFIDEIALNYSEKPLFTNGSATVKIYEEPNLGDTLDNGQERLFPLSLAYRCFAQ